jgi:hypothetical protein
MGAPPPTDFSDYLCMLRVTGAELVESRSPYSGRMTDP